MRGVSLPGCPGLRFAMRVRIQVGLSLYSGVVSRGFCVLLHRLRVGLPGALGTGAKQRLLVRKVTRIQIGSLLIALLSLCPGCESSQELIQLLANVRIRLLFATRVHRRFTPQV